MYVLLSMTVVTINVPGNHGIKLLSCSYNSFYKSISSPPGTDDDGAARLHKVVYMPTVVPISRRGQCMYS